MAEWYGKHRRLAASLQWALEYANALRHALEAKAWCTLPPGPSQRHTTWCARRRAPATTRARLRGEAHALWEVVRAATKPDPVSPWGAASLRAGLDQHARDHISVQDERRHDWPTPVTHLYYPQHLVELDAIDVPPWCRVSMRDVAAVRAFVAAMGRVLDAAEGLTYHTWPEWMTAEIEDHRRRLQRVTAVLEGLAARHIQRAWRECVSNPHHAVCTRRLMAEFCDLTASTKIPE